MNNQVTNFTNGFPNGVTIRGVPVLNTYSGKVFFVSNSGSNLGYNGTYESPFQTLAFALTQCAADKGDIIFLMPGYTEAVSSAAELTVDKSGVYIIGLGSGSDRPTFTFDTATTASILVSANNVTIENVLGVSGINALINPFNVTGDGFYCNIEWNDSLSTVEAARAILLTGVANSTINLKYVGFVNGDTVVNAVRLVGCSNVAVNIDAYGICTTAWVQFLTTACSNITINGQMYTQGITNLSRDVVDTVTGSTGFANIFDGSAAVWASGGSATSWVLSSDDVSSIGVAVAAVQADIGDPSAVGTSLDGEIRTGYDSTAITANQNGSVMERLEYIQANLTSAPVLTALGTDGTTVTDSATTVLGAIGANNANNAFDSSSVVANATGSTLERLASVQAAVAVAPSAASVTGAIGTRFWVKKILTSSAITQVGTPVATSSSGGELAVLNVILETDATGLATGTNVQLYSSNTIGRANLYVEAVAFLGANTTSTSSTTTVTTGRLGVLQSGSALVMNSTAFDCTGAGTVAVYVQFERLAAGATIAAA